MTPSDQACASMAENGFAVLTAVFDRRDVAGMRTHLETLFRSQAADDAIRSDQGVVVGARNVLALWPDAATLWRRGALYQTLTALLGPRLGLVRALYFDKPPDRTWALPWHKDLTIAVRDNRLPSAAFAKPTRKAGVPHVEASVEVLEGMATARIHLDDVTEENGPLRVLPGSHRTGKALVVDDQAPISVLADAGDVLVMRPLLAHSSNRSQPGTQRHRRILHLEFAAAAELPDGYSWFDFR